MAVRIPLALALLVATVLTACGDDGGSKRSGPTAPPSSSAPTAAGRQPKAVVIAHRGASAEAPEHTVAAYDLAIEQGADYIEQDLQLTADGELVVMHDELLDRTARGPAESCRGLVRTKTLAQLRQCDVGSWFNEAHPERADPAFAGLRIPTMREVVERYGRDVRYYVETKAPESQPGLEQALLDLLDDTGLSDTRLSGRAGRARPVIVQSFSPSSLRLIHGQRPDLPLVLLLVTGIPITDGVLADASTFAIGIGPAEADVDAAVVRAAHTRCLDVHPYTVDDPAAMAALLEAGVDGMFTDVPDVLLTQRADAAPPPAHCT